jgi:altronate dehydratase large subunit
MPRAELVLGLECGGSDALSGITANPALGVASDLLVGDGGTSILAETPELIGAEEHLAARAATPEVARAVRETILGFERAIQELGVDVRGAQPSPGNQAGGLTTIEEKSLGAAKKGGDAPIVGVLDYGERPVSRGLHIMDTPGHDIEQMVGMVAGGCQIVAFTTGRGTPTGCPIAPCVKISSNTRVFERLRGDIDFDAGAILDGGGTVRSTGEQIYELLLRVAAGASTASERRGNREFAISRTDFPAAART